MDGWLPFPFSFAFLPLPISWQRFFGPFSFIFQEVWGRGGCLIYKRCNFFSTSTYQFGSSICSLCASSTDSSPFSPILNICAAGGLDWIGQRKQTTGGRAAGEGKAKATEPTAWLHAPPWFAGIAVADWTIGAPLPSSVFPPLEGGAGELPINTFKKKKKKLALSCHPHILQPTESAAFAMAIYAAGAAHESILSLPILLMQFFLIIGDCFAAGADSS